MNYLKIIPFFCLLIACNSKDGEEKKQEKYQNSTKDNTAVAEGKRAPAKKLAPIIIGKLKYLADGNEIIAFNLENDTEIWRKTIYTIKYDSYLERDVQDVFIDSLVLKDSSLIIRNESNNWYFLDLINDKIYPDTKSQKQIKNNGNILTIGESYKLEFEHYQKNLNQINRKNKAQCLTDNLLIEISEHELKLKLTNNDFFTLRKAKEDKQFFGYEFKYFDPTTNLYILWENWLEAGHPIAVNAHNGEVTAVTGINFVHYQNGEFTANYADDLGSGWTPNGIQILQLKDETVTNILEFNPVNDLKENWGPTNLAWKNDSTLIVEFFKDGANGNISQFYKTLKFNK